MLDRSRFAQAGEYRVSVANQQLRHAVDELQLVEAARAVLRQSRFDSATISLAVVDDATIHELNRRYLDHDWPTDVLSFVLDEADGHLEGEVIISADTAASSADEVGCPAAAEQLLYVIHGMLHLIGYRDKTPSDRQRMRSAEQAMLQRFGCNAPPVSDDGQRPGNRVDLLPQGANAP
jgi:probable rRNA maturation factor